MGFKLSRTLKIRKRSLPCVLTLCVLLLPLFWGALFDLFKLPNFVKYAADVIWVLLLVVMLVRRTVAGRKDTVIFAVLVGVFLVYCLAVYLFRYQSAFYFLWGLRNNFRYYVYFFAVICFLTPQDADTVYLGLDILFWVNAVVSLIQYFVFGYTQDYLGGIFGVSTGCNALTIIFFTIVLGRSLLGYMNRTEPFWICLMKCAVGLLIVALAELKFFFVVFILLLGMAMVITAFSWRKLIIFALCIVLIIIGSSILATVFDFSGFLTFENVWELATQEHYSSERTVNRLSAVPTLARTILSDPVDRVFGLGLGNCDTSSFEICNTPFYRQHFYLKYNYFSSAFLFLEVGYIGLMLYVSFFVFSFIHNSRVLRSNSANINAQLGLVMSVLAVILMFYNSSLRSEAGYMVYFILALSFLGRGGQTELRKEQV